VMWKELVIPTIAIEFVSGDGSEERDATAATGDSKAGKFWVYEQAIQIPFYAIYEADKAAVEVYELVSGKYQRVAANQRGRYSIAPMGVELGIWQGEYLNQDFPWLRWWDNAGNLLLAGDELARQESLRADEAFQQVVEEKQRTEQEKQRADRLAAKLRELGIDPEDA
jgi:hypothetical protein